MHAVPHFVKDSANCFFYLDSGVARNFNWGARLPIHPLLSFALPFLFLPFLFFPSLSLEVGPHKI